MDIVFYLFIFVGGSREMEEGDKNTDHKRDYKSQTNQGAPEVKGKFSCSCQNELRQDI